MSSLAWLPAYEAIAVISCGKKVRTTLLAGSLFVLYYPDYLILQFLSVNPWFLWPQKYHFLVVDARRNRVEIRVYFYQVRINYHKRVCPNCDHTNTRNFSSKLTPPLWVCPNCDQKVRSIFSYSMLFLGISVGGFPYYKRKYGGVEGWGWCVGLGIPNP